MTQLKLFLIVDQILSMTQTEDYLGSPEKQAIVNDLEKKIDQLVYTLYELTPEEIEVIQGEDLACAKLAR